MRRPMVLLAVASVLVACGLVTGPSEPPPTASPVASATPTPSARVTDPPAVDPGPTPTSTPVPILAPDTLARIAIPDGVEAWERGGGRGASLGPVPFGEQVLLVDSSRAADGTVWWQVASDALVPERLGWLPATAPDGATTLRPFAPRCPEPGGRLRAEELPRDAARWLVCFGARELELAGRLRCSMGVAELTVQGAPWTDAYRWCTLDHIWVHGEVVTRLVVGSNGQVDAGERVVRGHWDDPGATHCVITSWGVTIGPQTGPGDPAAIVACRQQFVVTELLPVGA